MWLNWAGFSTVREVRDIKCMQKKNLVESGKEWTPCWLRNKYAIPHNLTGPSLPSRNIFDDEPPPIVYDSFVKVNQSGVVGGALLWRVLLL